MDVVIESVGGMCPVQGFGTIDGDRFYFRYRHDCAELYVGPDINEVDEFGFHDPMPDLWEPRLYAEIADVTGDYDRGWLEEIEAMDLIHRMVDMLKPPTQSPRGTGVQQLDAQVRAMTKILREKNNAGNEATN